MIRHFVLGFAATAIGVGIAAAEPAGPTSVAPLASIQEGRRVVVDTPLEGFTAAAQVSQTIYLERCKGGCTVNKGTTNDARTNTSTIPVNSTSTISEFVNDAGQAGTAADAEWAQVVQCMKEVYSPYNVMVTDVKPTAGVSYHEAIIAGNPQDVGLSPDILGIAPLAGDCSAQDNVISFSFANHHPANDRVFNICWTASQESAHAFGLDHEYQFDDGSSACKDPMTYRVDCGGEKFFRNQAAKCGENAVRMCRCGAEQNSHLKILSVFGPGTPITGNPTSAITNLTAGGTLMSSVIVSAGSKRGVAKVEIFYNGFKWAEAAGQAFGLQGQPNPSTYSIPVPASLPHSVVDVKAVAYDDLGASTDSPTITVTYGAPCATADTCAKGQKCDAGKCYWDPATGQLGDNCDYPQFCVSGICQGTAEQSICTQECVPGASDSCPSGFDCVQSAPGKGICFFSSGGGGCCSVDRGSSAVWLHGGLAALVLGFVLRRRKR